MAPNVPAGKEPGLSGITVDRGKRSPGNCFEKNTPWLVRRPGVQPSISNSSISRGPVIAGVTIAYAEARVNEDSPDAPVSGKRMIGTRFSARYPPINPRRSTSLSCSVIAS